LGGTEESEEFEVWHVFLEIFETLDAEGVVEGVVRDVREDTGTTPKTPTTVFSMMRECFETSKR